MLDSLWSKWLCSHFATKNTPVASHLIGMEESRRPPKDVWQNETKSRVSLRKSTSVLCRAASFSARDLGSKLVSWPCWAHPGLSLWDFRASSRFRTSNFLLCSNQGTRSRLIRQRAVLQEPRWVTAMNRISQEDWISSLGGSLPHLFDPPKLKGWN